MDNDYAEVEDGLSEVEDHAEVVNNVTEGNFYPTELTTLLKKRLFTTVN